MHCSMKEVMPIGCFFMIDGVAALYIEECFALQYKRGRTLSGVVQGDVNGDEDRTAVGHKAGLEREIDRLQVCSVGGEFSTVNARYLSNGSNLTSDVRLIPLL